MIGEREILLWIQDLQQSGGGIAAEVGAKFVYFIQHEDRIVRSGFANALNNPPRQCADISPPVSTDFRFVMHTAQGHTYEFPPERLCDRQPQRCFTDTGRPRETENRPLHYWAQFTDRKVFKDSVFDFVQSVMVLIEDLSGFLYLKAVFGRNGPGQFGQPF